MSEPGKSLLSSPTSSGGQPAGSDTYKGWLYKWTNYLKGYQRRWFVLSNGLLSYYRTAADWMMMFVCRTLSCVKSTGARPFLRHWNQRAWHRRSYHSLSLRSLVLHILADGVTNKLTNESIFMVAYMMPFAHFM